MQTPINQYGDQLILAGKGHGADISSQRADDLDNKAIAFVQERATVGQTIQALDLGAGRGAQAQRLLSAGATGVVACDMFDFATEFKNLTKDTLGQAIFIQTDLRAQNIANVIRACSGIDQFDVICFQRTIHYFTHSQAVAILVEITNLMKSKSRLYISASGLGSELAEGYRDRDAALDRRFCDLGADMQRKHGIEGPVCLYSKIDLIRLCEDAGLGVLEAQESSFGNIKVVAEKK